MSISIIFAFLGSLVLAWTTYELIVTTLTMNGGGPVSNWLASSTRRFFTKFVGSDNQKPLMAIGAIVLVVVILSWMLGTWAGWTLIFSWDSMSIVHDSAAESVGVWERIYYAGYTITTVGFGDFLAANSLTRVASVIAGVNGFSLLTLSLAYGTQILTAVLDKRSLATQLNTLENAAMPDMSAPVSHFEYFANELGRLDSDFAGIAQKYLAFPIIRFFPERNSQSALPLKVAILGQWIVSASARETDLPRETLIQFSKTRELLRLLVENAMNRQVQTDQAEEYMQLVEDYVESSGWNWQKDVCSHIKRVTERGEKRECDQTR